MSRNTTSPHVKRLWCRSAGTMVLGQVVEQAMRIGLFSDVHSNLAGLLAVANEFEREGRMDHVVVAGDHLWGGPRPREVWRLLCSHWEVFRGTSVRFWLEAEPRPLHTPLRQPRDEPRRSRVAFEGDGH